MMSPAHSHVTRSPWGVSRWRRRTAVTAASVVAILLAIGLTGCNPSAGDSEPRNRASTVDCSPGSTLSAPDEKAEVAVSEVGASVDRDPQGRTTVSYGVVLRNAAPLVADHLKVRIRVLDGSGTPLSFREDSGSPFTTEVEYMPFGLQPGERLGIGSYAHLEPAGEGTVPEEVKVEAEIHGVSWFLMCAPWGMQRLSVSDVETVRKGSTAVITFTADLPSSCPYSELTSDIANLHAIHYDNAGNIVGGDVLNFGEQDLEDPLASRADRVTATAHLPADAHPRRTELYTWAACAGSSPGPTAT